MPIRWICESGCYSVRGVGHEAGAVTQVEDRRRAAVMHGGQREIAEAAVVVGVIVPSHAKRSWQMARACSSAPNRFGNAGRYLKVRNCASENGLSLLTRGGRTDRAHRGLENAARFPRASTEPFPIKITHKKPGTARKMGWEIRIDPKCPVTGSANRASRAAEAPRGSRKSATPRPTSRSREDRAVRPVLLRG